MSEATWDARGGAAGERLTLPEEVLLLGWHDEQGRNRWAQNLDMLVAGATALELTLREAVVLDGDRLRPTGTRTGDGALDRALDEIAAGRRPPKVKQWVQRQGGRRKLRDGVLRRLVERGVARRETVRLLGLFPVTRYPVADTARTAALRAHVTRVLTHPDPVSDPRDAALGGLVHPGGGALLRRLVPSDRRQDARRRAKALSKGDAMNADVAKAISEVNATVMTAVTAAAAGGASSS